VRIEEPLPTASGEAAPDIYSLYEENIGAITPLIADDLKEAEERYPAEWVRAAIREAAELNARSWRYVAQILRRWEKEGPSYEKPGRDPEAEWLARRYREGKRSRA
jgi:DnaD/phage-associated family protein